MAFFDVRVFDPNANWYEGKTLRQCYITSEMKKKRKYNKRILQVENGSFVQLVFSVNDRMRKEASKCYSRNAEKLAEKRNEPYSVMMPWIRSKVFAVMKAIIMCIRGS